MSRRKIAALVVIAVVISASASWLAATRIRSPAEVAAQTAAPDAAPILVPVEERVLSTDVVTRGTARFGSPQHLTVTTSALKTGTPVITELPAIGAELSEGSVLLTAAGRPVFLVTGDRLGVRDLGPGLEGEDMRQLEEALERLGFGPGPVDGAYDGATEAAVSDWYAAAGYVPFTASEEQIAAIRALETDLATSRADLHGFADGVATAEGELAAARAARDDALGGRAVAPAAEAAAFAEGAAAVSAAEADVAVKTAALDDLLANRSGSGPSSSDPPSGDAIIVARAELAASQSAANAARRASEKAIAEAVAATSAADNAVRAADAAVRVAEQKLSIARAAAGDQRNTTSSVAGDVASAKHRAGVQVPADELILVPSTPVRVNELVATTGDQLGGPVMTVTDSTVAVDGALPLADASLVQAGMVVQIDEPDLGIEATGTISQRAETPGTNGADGFHIWFEVVVDGVVPNLSGASVRLTVPVESTSGKVLAVPTSAVWMGSDGSSRVERDDGNGKTTPVKVEPGLTAEGYVEVVTTDGKLQVGDEVLVGAEKPKGRGNG